MKLEIHNGEYVGTAEWREPGKVDLDVADPEEKEFFERYFEGEDAFLSGPVGEPEMHVERRDSSRAAFDRAVEALRRYAFTVKTGNGKRGDTYEPRAKSQ
jgi:hypothetical protein